MDSAAFPSLTPLFDGIDRWVELAPLLPVLIALELVLSADNAVALAAIAKEQKEPGKQRIALNIGILLALIFRIVLILMAEVVLNFWPLQLLAGIYLLGLFASKLFENANLESQNRQYAIGNKGNNLIKTIVFLAFTDLAFSIDSVAAAVAISDQYLLVITGASIGILALRFTAALFVKWLEIFPRLEFAGYLAVALVGVKLIILLIFPLLIVPEWFVLLIVAFLFSWGFSSRAEISEHNI